MFNHKFVETKVKIFKLIMKKETQNYQKQKQKADFMLEFIYYSEKFENSGKAPFAPPANVYVYK